MAIIEIFSLTIGAIAVIGAIAFMGIVFCLSLKKLNNPICSICGRLMNKDALSKKYGDWCSNPDCGKFGNEAT